MPSASIRPPSVAIAVTVPTLSKKSESKSEKIKRIAVTTVTRLNAPVRSIWPKRLKSGFAKIFEGTEGTLSPQPFGLTLPVAPSKLGPILNAFSTMTAITVVVAMPIRRAPLTLRTTRAIIRRSPKAKTTIGQPTRFPLSPNWTGTGPVPVRRTNPESTRPIMVMKRPIPTAIAVLSCAGTARKTAPRTPVRTRTTMIKPSMITSPIASAHVIREAIPIATNVLRPRPVASASGKLATEPIRMVSRPAISAVIAATRARFGCEPSPPRYLPSPSFARPMMRGLRATMYAMVKKVTKPPRISLATVEPRSVILKNESSMRDLPNFLTRVVATSCEMTAHRPGNSRTL